MLKTLLSAVPLDPSWFGKWAKPIVNHSDDYWVSGERPNCNQSRV